MYLLAILAGDDKAASVVVEKRRHDDSIIVSTLFPLTATLSQRMKACKCLGVSAELIASINLTKAKNQRIDITPIYHPNNHNYFIRGITGKAESRTEIANFKQAIDAVDVGSEHVVEWDGLNNLCCLDIDFERAPPQHQLIAAVHDLRFCPWFLFGTKSKSVHLIYRGSDIYSAIEFAASGMLEMVHKYPHAKYEFLPRTRVSYIEPIEMTQPTDLMQLKGLLQEREGTEGEFSDWLNERGMRPGGRYPHTKCPVTPDHSSRGNDPVQVHKHGIKCHKCGSDGIKYGSGDAGWFPSRALMGGRLKPGELLQSAINFVHFDQSRHELERFSISDDAQRALYSAVLKSVHAPDDPRIGMVWHPTGRKRLLRKAGYWVDENNETIETAGDNGLLHQLPFVHDLLHDYTTKVNPVRIAWSKQSVDLEPYGMHAYTSLTGYQFSRFDDSQTRILKVQPYYLRSAPHRAPKYIPESKRLEFDKCQSELEGMFPGINFPLIMLHLIGRGCSEYLSGRLAMTAITGPTGAGKTLHGVIASAISGDDPQWYSDQPDMNRFYDAVFKNSQSSGYFFADEVFKNYNHGQTGIVTALLQLGPNTSFHLLYLGQVRLGTAPYTVITETTIPLAVRQNEQIGRRFVHVHLNSVWNIDSHLHANGMTDVNHLRLSITAEQLNAFDSLLSWITDNHFADGKPDFFSLAKELGFPLLREGDAVEDKHTLIREFIAAIKEAPKPQGAEQRRFGAGFGVTRIGSSEALWQAFASLQTEQDKRKGDIECNMLDETDIASVCKLQYAVRVVIKRHGRLIGFKLQRDK